MEGLRIHDTAASRSGPPDGEAADEPREEVTAVHEVEYRVADDAGLSSLEGSPNEYLALDLHFDFRKTKFKFHFLETDIGEDMTQPISEEARRWVDLLSEEDLVFLKRFLLASGTLKELAKGYGISYPTVRLRLDRPIQKVELLDTHGTAGPFELRLRSLYADGRLDDETFRALLEAYRAEGRTS